MTGYMDHILSFNRFLVKDLEDPGVTFYGDLGVVWELPGASSEPSGSRLGVLWELK